jgi:ABC-type lipoprotein export system ATPase subunit
VSPPLVELAAVSRAYRRDGRAVPVLRDVDLRIGLGERVAIMGRSGSGKSTLLHVLGCLDLPDAGSYRFDGLEVGDLDDGALSRLRNRALGFVFQAFHLLRGRSIVDNVALPLDYAGVPASERRQRARELLALVGLGHRLDHAPDELSGGERQRVAIARALVNRPRLLLADEPTGALDTRAQRAILELFLDLHRRLGTTLVVVTHDPEMAAAIGQRTIRLDDGRVVEGGG